MVDGLTTRFRSSGHSVEAVKDVSFELRRGEILGIVGESGSGKSTLLMSILRLLPGNAQTEARSIRFNGRELLGLSGEEMRKLRGRELSLIPQRPMNSLSPVTPLGRQFSRFMAEAQLDDRPIDEAIAEMLEKVGLGSLVQRLRGYPHEFSGGQMQRILIAIAALSARPQVLFADEPTSTLDVTIQAQVLSLLLDVRKELGLSIVFVTHDLGVVAQVCDRVGVMYRGELIELADVVTLFESPQHVYTRALLDAVPSRHQRGDRLPSFAELATGEEGLAPRRRAASKPVRPDVTARVRLDGVTRHFPVRRGVFGRSQDHVYAVDGVTLEIAPGETVALVGESGCGKSTVARMLLGLDHPTRGRIEVDDHDIASADGFRYLRSNVQLVSQNPFSSLNRRRSILHALAQPLAAHGLAATREERRTRAVELLEQVGLRREHLLRYPSGMSVGQLQRVAVARALAVNPSVIVLDEPTASLDVSVKAMLVNLLVELRAELDLTYLWITHEIDIANHVSDRIAVMYLGRIVESGPTEEVFAAPRHPYTRSLLASVPIADPTRRSELRPLVGEVPSPINPPSGCLFHTRCRFVRGELCSTDRPELRTLAEGHLAACHYAEEILDE